MSTPETSSGPDPGACWWLTEQQPCLPYRHRVTWTSPLHFILIHIHTGAARKCQ